MNTLTPIYLLQLLILINHPLNDDMIGFYRIIRHVLLSFSLIPNWHSNYSFLYDDSKHQNSYLHLIGASHKDVMTGMANALLIFACIITTMLILKMIIKLLK